MQNKSLVFIIIISLLTFLSVTFIFTTENGYSYDQDVISWVEETSTASIVKVMDVISLVGSSEVVLLLTAIIAIILAFKREWFYTFFFLTVSVGGVAVNFILKVLFQRERPGEMSYIEVFNISLEIPSYSFPSGHTMRAMILLLFLIFISQKMLRRSLLKLLTYLFLTAIMIGVALSRLFLDAHFFSDVLGAISISIVWFFLCYLFFKRYEKKKSSRAQLNRRRRGW